MFRVKISFYGRGNVPRGLKGFGDRDAAINYAYDVIERYEGKEIVGPAYDKRIKKIEVFDDHRAVNTWYYTQTYIPGSGPYHGSGRKGLTTPQ